MLTIPYSYIVYIALIAGYLVLILFFFPETKYAPLPMTSTTIADHIIQQEYDHRSSLGLV